MPQRADTPTQRRGLAPELAAPAEAEPHRSCSASLSPSTLLSLASSASPSFIFSSKLLCSCGRARGRVTRGGTSRNACSSASLTELIGSGELHSPTAPQPPGSLAAEPMGRTGAAAG